MPDVWVHWPLHRLPSSPSSGVGVRPGRRHLHRNEPTGLVLGALMARKTVYVCDRCGNVLGDRDEFVITDISVSVTYRHGSISKMIDRSHDHCGPCHKTLFKALGKAIAELYGTDESDE